MYYENHYGNLESLGLPRTPRTYFDPLCHEFGCYPVESKMLDIGYLTTHGYDIRKDIYYSFQHFDHVSEDNVHRGVQTLEAAAYNMNLYESGITQRHNTLETDIDLMLEMIMRRYRLPRSNFSSHYMAEDCSKMDLYELSAMNGWKETVNEFIPGKMYDEENFISYPGDAHLIELYNDTHHPYRRIYTEMCPEPWYGNPVNARVIILSDKPLYDDFICRVHNAILDKKICDGIQNNVMEWMCLSDSGLGFHPDDKAVGNLSYMGCYNSPTYQKWFSRLADLSWEIDVHWSEVYARTAIINASPYYYYTPACNPLATGMLPSHYFLRQLLRYIIINNPNTLIIIPSKKLDNTWRTILGDVYYRNQIVKCRNTNASLSLTRRTLGDETYEEIATRLR